MMFNRITAVLVLICTLTLAFQAESEPINGDHDLLMSLSDCIEKLEVASTESKVLSYTDKNGARTGVAIVNDGENIIVLLRKTTIARLERDASDRKASNDPIVKKIDEATEEVLRNARKIYLELIVKELQWKVSQYKD